MSQLAASETKTPFREEDFMRMHRGHESDRFEFRLHDGSVVRGHVADSDLCPGDGPRKNRLFLSPNWPYEGNARIDPECTEIRFSEITSGRQLEPAN